MLRLTIGFMFFSGAIGKLGDLTTFTQMFANMGIPAAGFLAPPLHRGGWNWLAVRH
ncbi:DoxX family membrane protein [Mycobacterium kiyosense]|nr:hypothetical protein IWGMT90018_19070 [Mycobacterium kiyosense]